MGNKINLNELESALKDLNASKEQLDNFDIKTMSSYSMLSVDDQIRIAIIDLRAAVKECCDIFGDVTHDLGKLVKELNNVDNSRNLDARRIDSKYYQPYDYSKFIKVDDEDSKPSTSSSSRTSSGNSNVDKIDKKTKKKKKNDKNKKKKKKKKKKTASKKGKAKSKLEGRIKARPEVTGAVVSSTLPSLIENTSILKDPTPNNKNIIDKIKDNADTIISAEPIKTIDKNIDNNKYVNGSDNNATAVTATEIKNDNNEVKPQVYEGEIKVVSNNSDNNTSVASSNTSQQTSYTNNSSSIHQNASSPVESTPQVHEQQAPIESTPKVNIPDNEKASSTPKVITIDENSNMEVKKSNNLGAAIPIGLGTAALGTVAVVGTRYMKNKHNENNDEDSNIDDNLEYSDSANYDDNNNSDDYNDYNDNLDSGSAYEEVEIEDTYVDPEDLGDDYEDVSDSILEDLNSDY